MLRMKHSFTVCFTMSASTYLANRLSHRYGFGCPRTTLMGSSKIPFAMLSDSMADGSRKSIRKPVASCGDAPPRQLESGGWVKRGRLRS